MGKGARRRESGKGEGIVRGERRSLRTHTPNTHNPKHTPQTLVLPPLFPLQRGAAGQKTQNPIPERQARAGEKGDFVQVVQETFTSPFGEALPTGCDPTRCTYCAAGPPRARSAS